jgi:hypothetical protein
MADREADGGVKTIGGKGLCSGHWCRPAPGSPAEVGFRQLLEGFLQDLEVIGRRVGAGVAGAQLAGKGLSALCQITEQRVKAKAAVSSAPCNCLRPAPSRSGRRSGWLDVKNDLLWPGAGFPRALPGLGPGDAERLQPSGVDRLDHPVGGALGRPLPRTVTSFPASTPRSLTQSPPSAIKTARSRRTSRDRGLSAARDSAPSPQTAPR